MERCLRLWWDLKVTVYKQILPLKTYYLSLRTQLNNVAQGQNSQGIPSSLSNSLLIHKLIMYFIIQSKVYIQRERISDYLITNKSCSTSVECTECPLNNCISLNIFKHFDKFNFPWTQRIRGKTFLWWEQKQQEVLTRKSLPGGELAAPTERTICLLLLPNHWQLPSPALHTRTQWLLSSLPIPL